MNKVLKAGQIVFKAGDSADGMYLVRKGELVVFLEQNGKEVILAKVGEGGMIGEMALFDRQPRSASVKASADAEVTLISLDEFGKLMKQIPKWFVGLMSALSSRLRTTNDRLRALESSGGSQGQAPAAPAKSANEKPFQGFLRKIYLLELLWHKDGTKEGKEWWLQRNIVETTLTGVFGEPPEKVKAIIDLLVAEQAVFIKQDQYKNQVLSLANRGALKQVSEFIVQFSAANPTLTQLPPAATQMLTVIQRLLAKAPYEQFTASLEEIMDEAKILNFDAKEWPTQIKIFATMGETVKLVKTSSKSGVGLRVTKAEFAVYLRQLNTLSKIAAAKLD